MQINYKNQIYYVKDEDLVDNEKCFVFDDPKFNQPSVIWLCHVTEFVFGRYPERIYYE